MGLRLLRIPFSFTSGQAVGRSLLSQVAVVIVSKALACAGYGRLINICPNVRFTDPLGLWSPGAHDLFFDSLKGVASTDDIKHLKVISRNFDEITQWTEDANVHYMARPGQRPQDTRREAERSIAEALEDARNHADKNDYMGALLSLGEAMHTIQDSTSPVHVDSNGLPRVWNPSERKANILKGEQMPDPREDSSFQRYTRDADFVALMKKLRLK